MAEKDYYSFEEVLKNLKLEEDELKRLVSAGEIRAFRDKDTMRFKAEDVDRLRTSDGDELLLGDELELDLEEPAQSAASGSSASVEVEELDLGGEDELVLEEPVASSEVEELDLGGNGGEAVAPAAGRGVRSRGKAAAVPAGARRSKMTEALEDDGGEGMGMLAMLVIGLVIMIFANFVVLDAHAGHPSNPLSKAIANFFS